MYKDPNSKHNWILTIVIIAICMGMLAVAFASAIDRSF